VKPRPKVPPVPLVECWDHPLWESVGAVGAGCLFRLIRYYWLTECRPIPKGNADLQQICRCYSGSWKRVKTDVMTIWQDIEPGLKYFYSYKRNQAKSMREALSLIGQVSAGKRSRRKLMEDNQAPHIPASASGHIPRREAEFVLQAAETRRTWWQENRSSTRQAEAPKPPPAVKKFRDRG
jgi:uncharacterized protein YdaU (DUF1376 family)